MRNLKRALSMALASVMLLGMMVVGTSAGFEDVTAAHNEEAIEVVKAVGVMVGDANGNFNPEKAVTRNEAAVIMTNLMGLDATKFAGTSPFTDVPAWAEPYVAAAYANGITSGVSATEYGGDTALTTAQFSLMLMKVLGYFQNAQDFGDDWQIATVKQASKIALAKGVDSAPAAALVRNDVAQLVLNALEADVVDFTGDLGTDIKTSDGTAITIGYDSEYTALQTNGHDYTVATTTDGDELTMQLAEKLFDSELRKTTGTSDNYGRLANMWRYDNQLIGRFAKKADLVYTAATKNKTIYQDLGLKAGDANGFNVFVDGDDHITGNAAVLNNTSTTLAYTGNGAVTYVYYDADPLDTANRVIAVVNTYVGEVSYVGKNADDEREITIAGDNGGIYKFVTENFAEDDIVLFTLLDTNQNGSVTDETVAETVVLAEKKTGALTKVVGTNDYYIDGAKINGSAQKYVTAVAGDSVDFWTDAYGYIIRMVPSKEEFDASKFALILDNGSLGNVKGQAWVKLLFADGTTKVVDTYKDYKSADIDPNTAGTQTIAGGANQIVTFKVKDNGTYELTLKAFDSVNGDALMLAGKPGIGPDTTPANGALDSVSVKTDSKTIFVYEIDDSGDKDYKVYTGYKAAPGFDSAAATVRGYKEPNKSVAALVFVKVAKATLDTTTADDVIVAFDPDTKVTKVKDVANYYEFAAVVDGKITTLKVVSGDWAAMSSNFTGNAASVFDGFSVDDDGVVTMGSPVVTTDATTNIYVSNDTVVIGGVAYATASDVKVYVIDTDGAITSIGLDNIRKDDHSDGKDPYDFASFTKDTDGYVNVIVLQLNP